MWARLMAALAAVAVAALIGCNAAASPPPVSVGTAPASSPTVAVPSATIRPSQNVLSSTPTVFTSDRYGYTVPLPALWKTTQAATTWGGASPASPGHDGPYVDQFTAPPRYLSLWAYAAPTKLTLAKYATQTWEAAAAEHPCQKPDSDEPISLDGETARLLTINCGILVLIAVTIHNGSGAVFAFQDPTGDRSFDAQDRAEFMDFLAGIRFTS